MPGSGKSVKDIAGDLAGAMKVLQAANHELERRGKLLKDAGAVDIASYNADAEKKLPHVLVVIDEFADLKKEHKDLV